MALLPPPPLPPPPSAGSSSPPQPISTAPARPAPAALAPLFAILCGWKNAHRYALTGDHFDAAEALRIGAINEVVPHDHLMERARELALRLAKVPAESVRLNKAITTYGLEAMGLRSALNMNGVISAIVEAENDGPDTEHLDKAQAEGGFGAFLKARDDPFRPEPFGPRSQPRG
ncbi:MAG: enoyl-CoA hydratase-related protein [Chloroflexi bacterium]|nr:enoyl-CoA hydratase-related protein [Chloroflexota bacterium]MDA1145643.1 enoyl-CoA hydratase-related protein [Chloroflexota bacterium]